MCQNYKRSKPNEPIMSHELPHFSLLKVGADIAEWAGNPFIVFVDYYSKWLEVIKINNKTSISVKKCSYPNICVIR